MPGVGGGGWSGSGEAHAATHKQKQKPKKAKKARLFAAIGGVKITSGQGRYWLHHPSVYDSRTGKSSAAALLKVYFADMKASKELLPRMQRLTPQGGWMTNQDEEAALLHMEQLHPSKLLSSSDCKDATPPSYCVKLAGGS